MYADGLCSVFVVGLVLELAVCVAQYIHKCIYVWIPCEQGNSALLQYKNDPAHKAVLEVS